MNKRDAQGRFLPKSAKVEVKVAPKAAPQVEKLIQGIPMKEIVALGQKAISLLGTSVVQKMEAALIEQYKNDPIFVSNMEKLLPIYLKLGMTDVANTVADKLIG